MILRHTAFDAHKALVARAVAVGRHNIYVPIEHLDKSVRAIITILLPRPAVVDYGCRLIAGRVIFEAWCVYPVVGSVVTEAGQTIGRYALCSCEGEVARDCEVAGYISRPDPIMINCP